MSSGTPSRCPTLHMGACPIRARASTWKWWTTVEARTLPAGLECPRRGAYERPQPPRAYGRSAGPPWVDSPCNTRVRVMGQAICSRVAVAKSTTSEPSSCLAHPVALNVVSTLWPLIRSPFHTVMPPTQKISQPQLILRTTARRWLRPTSWLRLPVVIARRDHPQPFFWRSCSTRRFCRSVARG